MDHSIALILGGGGSTAQAWEIGVIAGLVYSGLDVTEADLTVGTSAGSTVAAQIGAAHPSDCSPTLSTPPQSREPVLPVLLVGEPRRDWRRTTWRG